MDKLDKEGTNLEVKLTCITTSLFTALITRTEYQIALYRILGLCISHHRPSSDHHRHTERRTKDPTHTHTRTHSSSQPPRCQ